MTVPEVELHIKEYLMNSTDGLYGNLSIFFKGNTKDSHLLFLKEVCEREQDVKGIELLNILLCMSRTQRLKLSHVSLSDAF